MGAPHFSGYSDCFVYDVFDQDACWVCATAYRPLLIVRIALVAYPESLNK